MYRKFGFFAAALAAFLLTVQVAEARERKRVDPALNVVSTGVGLGWTAVLYGLNEWRWRWNSDVAGISRTGAVIGTTIGCAATSTIVATMVLNRPLKYREAHILVGSCVVPIIGGWLVNEAYNNGWFWAPDEKPVRKVSARHR
jgi:hypothetical protein